MSSSVILRPGLSWELDRQALCAHCNFTRLFFLHGMTGLILQKPYRGICFCQSTALNKDTSHGHNTGVKNVDLALI